MMAESARTPCSQGRASGPGGEIFTARPNVMLSMATMAAIPIRSQSPASRAESFPAESGIDGRGSFRSGGEVQQADMGGASTMDGLRPGLIFQPFVPRSKD